MKHFKLTFLLIVIMSMVGAKALAYDAEIDGIYYNLSDTKATVTYKELDEDRDPYSDYKGNIVIPDHVIYKGNTYSVTSIGENAFRGCNLTSVIIPSSVTSVGQRAFYYCSSLTSISIPNNVKVIGMSAFEGCRGLTSIIIGNGVGRIEGYTFGDCTNLKSVTFGTGLLSISKNAFRDHWDSPIPQTGKPVRVIWQSETPPEGYKSCIFIGEPINYVPNDQYDFSGYTYKQIVYPMISSMFESNGVIYVPTSMSEHTCDVVSCVYNESVETVNIGKTILYNGVAMTTKNISAYFCIGYSGLTSVTIPNSVTSIGGSAFNGCSGLTSIEIPNSVTSIGSEAFHGCSGLTSVTIGNSVTSIGFRAFYGCSGLTSIEIPNSVTSIGLWAFSGCRGLTSVTIKKEAPLSIDEYTISNRANATLYVPNGSKAAYEAADYWKEFKEIIEMDPRCATPTISYKNGELTFDCETEGVKYVSTITVPESTEADGKKIDLSKSFRVSVYATKEGYTDSDIATQDINIRGIKGDVDGDGE